MLRTLCVLSLAGLMLASVACDTTRVHRRYEENTVETSKPETVQGTRRPAGSETRTEASEPTIVVE